MVFIRVKVNMLVVLYFKIINDSLLKLVVFLNFIIYMYFLSIDKRIIYKLYMFNFILKKE